MKKNKKQYFSMLAVWSVVMLASVNSFAKTPLKVGYLPILDHLTLLVSHAQDNASLANIAIEPKMFKSWEEMAGALRAGKIDGCYMLAPLAMDLFNSGVAIKTILLGHRNGSAITVGKDAAIYAASDLKGKRIGIPYQISTHAALLDAYLRTAGLSLQDVATKVIAPPNMEKALKGGSIDAFIAPEPFGAKAQLEGYGRIVVLTKEILNNHVECIVVVNNQALQENPAGIQEWVDSVIRAGQFIEHDKLTNGAKDTAKIAVQYLPYAEQAIMNGLQNPSDRISFSDLQPVAADFQQIVDLSVRAGILTSVALNNFIDDRFFQASSAK